MDIRANHGNVFVLFSDTSYNYISVQGSLDDAIFYGPFETKKLNFKDYEIETNEEIDNDNMELFAEIVSDKSFILRLFTKDTDGDVDDIEPFSISEYELCKIAKNMYN